MKISKALVSLWNLVVTSKHSLFALLVICILQLHAVYAYEEYNHVLTIESPNPQVCAWFGYGVKINGDIIVINEPYANVGEVKKAGKVYIYETNGNLLSTLQSPTPGPTDNFGLRIDVLGDTISVVEGSDIGDLRYAGKVHLFATNGTFLSTIESPEPSYAGYFGTSGVSLGDDLIVVNEQNSKRVRETSLNAAGEVHLFDGEGNYLKSLLSPMPIIYGKFSVEEVGEGMIICGEVGDTTRNLPIGSGSVHIFDYEGNHLMTLKAPEPEEHAVFGLSISISGDWIVIGEAWATVEGVWRAGRAYIFNTEGECLHTLQSPNPKSNAYFGDSVDIDGDRLVIGEWDAHVNPGRYEGRVYVYDVDGNLIQSLTAPDPYPRAAFGLDVDIEGDTIVVGECWAGTEEMEQAGRVHVYRLGPPMVALFEVGNLVVQPSSVEVDKSVTISADVSNTGNKTGTHLVKLVIDGELCEEKEVTVDAGLTEKVTFTYQTSVEGTHQVEMGDLEGSFKVEKSIPGYPLHAIIVGLVAVSFLAWFKQRRSIIFS